MNSWSRILLTLFLLTPALYASDWAAVLAGSNFTTTEQVMLGGLITTAVSEDLPEELLAARLKEGIAKKVDFDRLKLVINREIYSLKRARTILTEELHRTITDIDLANWQRTALLLNSGLSDQQTQFLIQSFHLRWNDYLLASTSLFSLHDWGLSWADSLLLIGSMAQSTIEAKDFPALVGILAEARHQQIRPADMLERIAHAAAKSSSMSALKRNVLP